MANVINGTSTGSGGLISSGDDSGILNIQTNETTAMSIDASQSIDFTNNIDAPNTFGFKNRIINGNMVIDQRNAGASVSATNAGYTLDRWFCNSYDSGSVTGKFTVQQNSGNAPLAQGFSQCVKITSSAATVVNASTIYAFKQAIEGLNVSDLAWGTASAKTVTISFWVYSSLTGAFGGAVQNEATNYNYPFQYTINSANTWEYKTVTIAGPTAGTWSTTTSVGLYLVFGLGGGSTFSQPANAWTTNTAYTANSSVNFVSTSGATIYFAGVQLEKGTQATSFDFRSYGTELALCQRYYWRISGETIWMAPIDASQNYRRTYISYKTSMRAVPTVTMTANIGGAGAFQASNPEANSITANGFVAQGDVTSTASYVWVSIAAASAEL